MGKHPRILALDLGVKTCGLAISDPDWKISYPLEQFNFKRYDFASLISRIAFWLEQYKISTIVLGYPLTLNGKISPRTKMVENFAYLIKKNLKINVIFQDERFSTKQAQNFLLDLGISFKKRQKIIDKLAAQIILERFLETVNKKQQKTKIK
ncbi:Holliday junction resolvase RuvX [Mesomycoplasma flocculare]|nr:Holliday junction resolvase RuvX [Mesomycoplasma flocculare]MXR22921.1 Holliday junction resolvase RuvX [Mesomycoplasma flocculare]